MKKLLYNVLMLCTVLSLYPMEQNRQSESPYQPFSALMHSFDTQLITNFMNNIRAWVVQKEHLIDPNYSMYTYQYSKPRSLYFANSEYPTVLFLIEDRGTDYFAQQYFDPAKDPKKNILTQKKNPLLVLEKKITANNLKITLTGSVVTIDRIVGNQVDSIYSFNLNTISDKPRTYLAIALSSNNRLSILTDKSIYLINLNPIIDAYDFLTTGWHKINHVAGKPFNFNVLETLIDAANRALQTKKPFTITEQDKPYFYLLPQSLQNLLNQFITKQNNSIYDAMNR